MAKTKIWRVKKMKCAVCNIEIIEGDFDVCPHCGWEADFVAEQEFANKAAGANDISFNQAKTRVAQGKNVVDGGALPWQSDYAGNSPSSPPGNVANTARRP
jgi:hypothetical protein